MEESPNFARKTNGDFDRTIGRPLREKNENLKSHRLVGNALIDDVCYECSRRMTNPSRKVGGVSFIAIA